MVRSGPGVTSFAAGVVKASDFVLTSPELELSQKTDKMYICEMDGVRDMET